MMAQLSPRGAPHMASNGGDSRTRRMTRSIHCVLLVLVLGCSGSPTEPSEGGGEPGESGTRYNLNDTARESRAGVDLVMSYDTASETFRGTVTNTTSMAVAGSITRRELSRRHAT